MNQVTRREFVAGLSAAALPAAAQRKEDPPTPAKPSHPMICLASKFLAKLNYMDLGPVLKDLGFDGCDLAVEPGGHVLPQYAQVDLLRAIEAIRGEGVDVPMITTSLVSAMDWTARPVLGIAGTMKVQYYQPGYWQYGPTDNPEASIAQVRRDLAGLVAIGRAYGMVAGFHNHSGSYVGAATWDTRAIIGDMDPNWVGYCFDPGQATAEGGAGGWNVAMRLALPRLKMAALADFYWAKSEGKWKMTMCPMGQGMVDWPSVFSILAAARFTGPLSLRMEYNPPDELHAMARDLEFVKKQVAAAYGSAT
ncbi:MAG TPA: sugar phosphate isomerase/epimerase family protein [Bryobacteraceae bacterium]|nr:sugar phosphate isomerase/epimerase family protein [Bryobacteraceae bacterium]